MYVPSNAMKHKDKAIKMCLEKGATPAGVAKSLGIDQRLVEHWLIEHTDSLEEEKTPTAVEEVQETPHPVNDISSGIELSVNGVTISVDDNTDMELLSRVIAAVKHGGE